MKKRCEHCGQPMPEFGGIVLDEDRGEVRFGGHAVHLPSHAFHVLRFLLDKKGAIASKEAMLDYLYQLRPDSDQPEIKIIDVYVRKLRALLAPIGLEIGTSRGRGYFLHEPKQQVAA